MYKGVPDALVRWVTELGLVQRVDKDEEVIDADSYQEERNELVDSPSFIVKSKANGESSGIGDENTAKTDDSD